MNNIEPILQSVVLKTSISAVDEDQEITLGVMSKFLSVINVFSLPQYEYDVGNKTFLLFQLG